jgi:glycosyltransferase involved in cell wall biosynthesis
LTNINDNRFEQSLASVQFAKEILIVDNKSQNDWQNLAKKYHFQVLAFDHPIKNFAEVRNWALKHASESWVLFLDADEELKTDSEAKLKEVMENNLFDGVFIWRSDIFLGKQLKFGEAGRLSLLRFFKKDLTSFNYAIHEVAKVSGKVGQSEVEITHLAHVSISKFLEKVFFYSYQIGKSYHRDKLGLILEILLLPIGKFIYNFIFKLGFLDGWRGLIYATVMSLHSLIVRITALENHYAKNFKTQK